MLMIARYRTLRLAGALLAALAFTDEVVCQDTANHSPPVSRPDTKVSVSGGLRDVDEQRPTVNITQLSIQAERSGMYEPFIYSVSLRGQTPPPAALKSLAAQPTDWAVVRILDAKGQPVSFESHRKFQHGLEPGKDQWFVWKAVSEASQSARPDLWTFDFNASQLREWPEHWRRVDLESQGVLLGPTHTTKMPMPGVDEMAEAEAGWTITAGRHRNLQLWQIVLTPPEGGYHRDMTFPRRINATDGQTGLSRWSSFERGRDATDQPMTFTLPISVFTQESTPPPLSLEIEWVAGLEPKLVTLTLEDLDLTDQASQR